MLSLGLGLGLEALAWVLALSAEFLAWVLALWIFKKGDKLCTRSRKRVSELLPEAERNNG